MTNTVQQARQALGYRLRDIRKDARLSARQLAVLTGWHFTKISKIEHGRAMPSRADVETWCFHCGAERQIPDLTATVRSIEHLYAELRRLMRTGTAGYQQELLEQESSARHLRIFNPAIIPGSLQTPRYAAVRLAEFADMVGVPADVEQTVAIRMQRANLLTTGDHLFHVIVTEHALHIALADSGVMEEQLGHLLEVSRLARLRLGVVPTHTRQYMPLCGFWIFDDNEVQIETYSAAIRITQPREIAMYAKVFDQYAKRATYGQRARDLIYRAIQDRPADCS